MLVKLTEEDVLCLAELAGHYRHLTERDDDDLAAVRGLAVIDRIIFDHGAQKARDAGIVVVELSIAKEKP